MAFVFDVMFPYIRANVSSFLKKHWTEEAIQEAVQLVGIDVGENDLNAWLGGHDEAAQPLLVCQAVNDLMDCDAKVTGLKKLQGMIWKDGFESGELVAELFPDVLPKLRDWKSAGLDLFIYSSGSIGAQKLFFSFTTEGNLLDLFNGHFDTTSGNKKETASYRTIADEIGMPPQAICFVSDVLAEVDSAAEAGMQTLLRPVDSDNESSSHAMLESFAEIKFSRA